MESQKMGGGLLVLLVISMVVAVELIEWTVRAIADWIQRVRREKMEKQEERSRKAFLKLGRRSFIRRSEEERIERLRKEFEYDGPDIGADIPEEPY